MQNISLDDFPKHPFWKFSLAVYADPKIKEACLLLQDHYGLNVNVLLFCCWAAHIYPKKLTQADIKKAHQAIATWHKNVTCKLREIRKQTSKQINRTELLQIELYAEFVEQMLLADSLVKKAPATTTLSTFALTQANVVAYLRFTATKLKETDQPLLLHLVTHKY